MPSPIGLGRTVVSIEGPRLPLMTRWPLIRSPRRGRRSFETRKTHTGRRRGLWSGRAVQCSAAPQRDGVLRACRGLPSNPGSRVWLADEVRRGELRAATQRLIPGCPVGVCGLERLKQGVALRALLVPLQVRSRTDARTQPRGRHCRDRETCAPHRNAAPTRQTPLETRLVRFDFTSRL